MVNYATVLDHEIIDDLNAILGEGFQDIICEQIAQADIYLAALRESLSHDKPEECMRLAHALKSSTGQIGLSGIYGLAQDLESLCRQDEQRGSTSAAAQQIFEQIEEQLPHAIEALRHYLRSA